MNPESIVYLNYLLLTPTTAARPHHGRPARMTEVRRPNKRKCDDVRRRSHIVHRTIKRMADHRESDVLAYILGVLVLAISGVAVGIASTTPPGAGGSGNESSASAALQAPEPHKT
jgi:hypothetical protein